MNIFDIESNADSKLPFNAPVTEEKLYLLLNNCLLQHIKQKSLAIRFKYNSLSDGSLQEITISQSIWGQHEALISFPKDYVDPMLGLLMKLSGHCFDGTIATDNGKVVRIKFFARWREQLYIADGHMVLNPMKERCFTLSKMEKYPKRKKRSDKSG